MKPTHKNMPSRERVTRYWVNNHRSHPESLPWWGRGSYCEDQIPEDCKWCFACKRSYPSVDRAHILPLTDGGDNECGNLHLLCHTCHKESEHLTGDKYWRWIEERRWWHVHAQEMVVSGIITTTEKNAVVLYCDACASGDKVIAGALEGKVEPIVDRLLERVKAKIKSDVERESSRVFRYAEIENKSGMLSEQRDYDRAIKLIAKGVTNWAMEFTRQYGPRHYSLEEIAEFHEVENFSRLLESKRPLGCE